MATGRLSEVEQDAMRITEKRFRDQEEDRQYKEAKSKLKEAEKPVAEVETVPSSPALEKESKK